MEPDVHTEVQLKSAKVQNLVNNLQDLAELLDHLTSDDIIGLANQIQCILFSHGFDPDIIHYFALACPPFILFN